MHRLIRGRRTAIGDLANNAKSAWNGASKLRLVLDVLLPEWVEGFAQDFNRFSSLDSIHKSENGEYLNLIGIVYGSHGNSLSYFTPSNRRDGSAGDGFTARPRAIACAPKRNVA